jgi:hypothetical protein
MRVVDLHPDELLDRAEHGELSAAERARLDAHLADCVACRFEIKARRDFADDMAADRADELPRAEREPEPEVAPVPPPLPPLPSVVRPVTRRYRPGLLLLAATLLAAGAAGATGAFDLWHAPGPSPAVVASTPPAPNDAPSGHEGGRRRASPTSMATNAPLDAEALPPIPSPSGAAPASLASTPPESVAAANPTPASPRGAPPPSLPSLRPKSGADSSTAGLPSTPRAKVSDDVRAAALPDHVAPPPAGVAPAPVVTNGAEPLFEAANEARRRGDVGRALALYRELDRGYASSPEAHVARATSGKLLLERGEAVAALARFDAYLATGGGPLSEEVMAGRALALGRLGRAPDEADAWTALLRRHPGSVHAPRAEARLRALGTR